MQDISGEKYGRWTVLYKDEEKTKKNKHSYWICQCECGNIKTVNGYALIHGKSKSCGCLSKEMTSKRFSKDGTRHGRLYGIYCKMLRRCNNPKDKRYSCYGGRGISVCEEWKNNDNGWNNFQKWALNNGYKDDLSIDRIDVNGNYDPLNCRWADIITQANNTSRNVYVTINGKTQTATQWCHEYGFQENLFYSRMKKGITGEDLLKPPKNTYIVTNLTTGIINKYHSIAEFSSTVGISGSYLNTLFSKSLVFEKGNFKFEKINK